MRVQNNAQEKASSRGCPNRENNAFSSDAARARPTAAPQPPPSPLSPSHFGYSAPTSIEQNNIDNLEGTHEYAQSSGLPVAQRS